MDEALKQRIREWAAANGKEMSEEQIEGMMKGVRFWFDTNITEVFDIAYDATTWARKEGKYAEDDLSYEKGGANYTPMFE